jgi:hypothetical protein
MQENEKASLETMLAKEQRKRVRKSEVILREMGDTCKHTNKQMMSVPEGEVRKEWKNFQRTNSQNSSKTNNWASRVAQVVEHLPSQV